MSFLKSSSCNSESKVIFLKEFAAHIEKEIEALEVKIQSLSFQNPFQLSFDTKIEKCYENKDNFDDPKLKLWYCRNFTQWYDPVAKYMEEFFNSRHFFG